MTDYDAFYANFPSTDVDSIRVEQYDAIMEDEELPAELKEKMQRYYNTLSTVKGLGDKICKSIVISVIRLAFLTPEEERTTIKIGWMMNSLAPEAARVQRKR